MVDVENGSLTFFRSVEKTPLTKYYLSNLPADTGLAQLVASAHMRWRIERDYQDLKQELGLGHYEGRGWRGFHHHAALAIAAYGFLLAERLATGTPVSAKTSQHARHLLFPKITLRGEVRRAQRHTADSLATIRYQLTVRLVAVSTYAHAAEVR